MAYWLYVGTTSFLKNASPIPLISIVEETSNGLLTIVKRRADEDSSQGLVLGCIELLLILTKDEFGIPFLNTTKIHVDSVIRYCLMIDTPHG